MGAVLLVLQDCGACARAEATWRRVFEKHGTGLEVLGVDAEPGAQLARRLRVTTFPALVIDDDVVAVGVPSPEAAWEVLRRHDSADYPSPV